MGRPAKYAEAEAFEAKVNEYFNGLLDDPERPQPPTMAGLALHLGYTSRQSLYDAEKKKDEFSYIIKRARLKIEGYWETRLAGNSPTGAIFWLKNHSGYNDKTTQELTGADGSKLIPDSVEISFVKAKA